MAWDDDQTATTSIEFAEWNNMRDYIESGCKHQQGSTSTESIFASKIIPDASGTRDLGTNILRFDNVYAGDLWGNPHYQDMFFKETWCDICKESFKKGEIVVLIVKDVQKEMSAVPVHLKCSLETVKIV